MRKKIFSPGVFTLVFCLLFAAATAQAADVGKVIIVVPGATVTRNGQPAELRQHSPLQVSDTVSTNATGRARILFNDDSTVDLGSNTSLDMREFADSGASSVFKVHLLQGVARVITGKIVEQNPGGFAVSTPEGTIGIRGTIISVRTGNGTTTVYVENTTRAVYVNNIHVPGGQKITLPADPLRPEPILPQDRRNLGRDLAFRGGTGVAAAAPEPMRDSGQPEEQPRGGTTQLVAEADLIPPGTSLNDISLGTQSLGDSLLAGGGTAGGGTAGGGTAMVKGSLTSTGGFSLLAYGDFGFQIDLGSGAISNAGMSGGTVAGAAAATSGNHFDVGGGSGTFVSGGTTLINGFTGTLYSGGTSGFPFSVAATDNTWMTLGPTSDPSSSAPGSVTGGYNMDATSSSWSNADSGTLSGQRVP
jgi:hypothetical protein